VRLLADVDADVTVTLLVEAFDESEVTTGTGGSSRAFRLQARWLFVRSGSFFRAPFSSSCGGCSRWEELTAVQCARREPPSD